MTVTQKNWLIALLIFLLGGVTGAWVGISIFKSSHAATPVSTSYTDSLMNVIKIGASRDTLHILTIDSLENVLAAQGKDTVYVKVHVQRLDSIHRLDADGQVNLLRRNLGK